MAAVVRDEDVAVGTALPAVEVPVRRVDLVRYAGASGDFNPIHWNARVATSMGLPDVIAHGMFTMGAACRVLTDWAGDPAAVVEYGVRFTKPVVVPDDEAGVVVHVAAVVKEKLAGRRARVDLTVTAGGQKVLGRAQAVVQLA